MANGTGLGINILHLLFLLAPGYLALRGYHSASVQIDDTSRIDKLLLAVVGGLVSLAFLLVLNRFGVFQTAVHIIHTLIGNPQPVNLGYDQGYAITPSEVENFNALAILGFIFVQSGIGYIGGYVAGTIIHVRSDQPQKSDKDLQQPWETAVRQSALGDRVVVVTRNSDKIRGRLYRIGSPSKDFDLLISAAERVTPDYEENEPLGVTYHHYRDISQVRFPKIKPKEPSPESNRIVRARTSFKSKTDQAYLRLQIIRYGYVKISTNLLFARECAELLKEHADEYEEEN